MLENLEVLRDSEKITTERSNTCDDFLTIGFRDQGDSSVHRRLAVLSSTHEKNECRGMCLYSVLRGKDWGGGVWGDGRGGNIGGSLALAH